MLSNHPSVLGSGAAGVTTPAAASAALDLISTTQGAVLYRDASEWTALTPGTAGQLLSTQGAAADPIWVTATGGAGDFNGPASSTDNAIVRFDGAGGKTGQNSAVTIADTTGAMTFSNAGGYVDLGASSLTATAVNTGGLRSANFGLSTVSGGASYFGGNGNFAGTTSATSSTVGALTVGNGSAATNVAIGGGSAWAGNTVYAGAASTDATRISSDGLNVTKSADNSSVKNGVVLQGTASSGSTLPAVRWYATGLQELAQIYPQRTAGSFATSLFLQTATAGGTLTTGIEINSSQAVKIPAVISATSSVGAVMVGAQTGSDYVNIGGGNINAGGTITAQGLFYPQQATTAGAPAYVKGAIYFDTTLNKLRVGGATAWETITSV